MPISRRDVLVLGSAAGISSLVAPLCAAATLPPATPKWTLPERKPLQDCRERMDTDAGRSWPGGTIWIPEGATAKPVPVVFEYLPYEL